MKALICLLLFCFSLSSHATHPNAKTLKLPAMFSDHMVLQQKQETAFWGQAAKGQKVTIMANWGKKPVVAIADNNGNWSTKLATPPAGGPYTIRISTSDDQIDIGDVLIGEVWLASGQSNMEMPLKGWPPTDLIANSEREIAAAKFPNIRFIKVPENISAIPLTSFEGKWNVASPQTAADFSATAYFYARKLQHELKVPIGIIQCCVSGTPAEAWTSNGSLAKLGDFNERVAKLGKTETASADWFSKAATLSIPATAEQWKSIAFSDLAAAEPGFDDSKWTQISLPARIDLIGTNEFDGALWLRREFTIADTTTDFVLKIGAVDDMDATYVNGKYVGGLTGPGFHNIERKILIPKSLLKKGKNSIAIRVIDTGGPGLVSGPITISNEKGETIALEGNWKSRLVAEVYHGKFYYYDLKADLSNRPDISLFNNNSPTVLYNAMINPLLPYTIKGAIWYQGEGNVGRAEQYKKLFPAMITDWRNKWGYDFPFYFVEIAPFAYTSPDQLEQSQKLRNAQLYSLATPKTGMVSTLDIGDPANIHPSKKLEVGERLARLALANDYGKKIVASGPLFKSAAVSGTSLIVSFEGTGTGLRAADQGLENFEIAGKDQVFVKAQAKIEGDKVVVSSPGINAPLYVRYAWSDTAVATLFNMEGLPAATFSSDGGK